MAGRTPEAVARDRSALPKLGAMVPRTPFVLDANVLINGLAGRGPPILRQLVQALPEVYIAAPTRAELSWVRGRLDPDHSGTAGVLAAYGAMPERIDPAKVLIPDDADWDAAGALAGRAARAMAGGERRITTAFDRVELISDALTAIVTRRAGYTLVTEDADFDVLAQLLPGLRVLFYDRSA